MLLLILFSLLAILLRAIAANSDNFGLLVIRSDSPLQNAGVYSQDDQLYVGESNHSLSAVVTDYGFLLFDNGNYAAVGNNGEIKQSTLEKATDAFAIRNGHLRFSNSDRFEAAPKKGEYLFSTKSTTDSLGIIIRAQSLREGYAVPDFIPANNRCCTAAMTDSGLDSDAIAESYVLNGSRNSDGTEIHSNHEGAAASLKRSWKMALISIISIIMISYML